MNMEEKIQNRGIIYLIQPEELIGTNRYKIGCSKTPTLDRVNNGYKKGSRYLYIGECENPHKIEKNIKKEFNKKFKLIAGYEYFEGDENEIMDCFSDVLKIKNIVGNVVGNVVENVVENVNENVVENVNFIVKSTINKYVCQKCGIVYTYEASLNKHLIICTGHVIMCKLCDIVFNHRCNLITHNKKFHLDCTCQYCKKTFNNQNSIYLHQKNHCKMINLSLNKT